MDAMASGHQVGSILLAGDPGIGKTTFVGLLAQLLGMNAVIIEIPHITEEHLINIPFLVFDSNTGATSHNSTNVSATKMKMVLADSNLFSALQKAAPMSDQQYLQHMQHAPAHVQHIFQQMGGNATTIPPSIEKARQHHSTILFLDEYYRMTSMRIRNIMRGILNGNIGMHKIPKNVYIMYASNMRDPHAGLEEIPSNHQFNVVEYKAPNKEDWFSYLVSKYEQHTHIKLNPDVIAKFKSILTDEDISYEDVAVGVRTSPRRWEQLITYINTSIPVNSPAEGRALLTNVKNNFIHYQEETHSDLADKVVSAVAELIKQTSGTEVDKSDTLEPHEWRAALDHAIVQIKRSGGDRKHIPVISGAPGIGKAQPLYSKIKTPTGWTTMGKVRVGDVLTMPNGDSAPVSAVYPQGRKEIFELVFADGRKTHACAEHLWNIKKDREHNWQVVDTKEMDRLLRTTNRWVYVQLPNHTAPDASVPMDPYLLGVLLGDGSMTSHTIGLSTADPQMLSNVNSLLAEGYTFKHNSNYDYRLTRERGSYEIEPTWKTAGMYENVYIQQLSALGLLGKSSLTKFIPSVYKDGSRKQIEQLLAGLIDTDGYVNKQGAISVTTSSIQLAEDIQCLVRSIGGIAKIAIRYPTYTYRGEKKNGNTAYTVSIRYPTPRSLSRLDRKLDRIPEHYQYSDLHLRLVSIDSIGEDEAQCIMVDHPDHLYITDDYIVTHNTSQAWKVAEDHNLRLIEIDVSELFAEDAVGMPLPGDRNGDQIKIKFSAPKLYKQIMDMIERKDEAYIEQLVQEYGDDARAEMAKYQKQPFKYLILLDELNRVDQKTFNALRRVILEKNFGGRDEDTGVEYKLPKSAIVIGAINPHGAGTETLTQHFRDAIDVIPAKASWKDTKQWLASREFKGISPAIRTFVTQLIDEFVKKFSDKSIHDANQRAFQLDIGGMPMYVSPREYSDMYATLNRELNTRFDDIMNDPSISEADMRPEIDDAIGDALEDSLNMVFYKQNPDMKDEFMHKLRGWVQAMPDNMFGDLLTKKAAGIDSLSSTLEKYMDGADLAKMPDDVNIVNANNTINHAQFMDEVHQAVQAKIVDDASMKKYILDESVKRVKLENDQIVAAGDKTTLLTNFFLALLYTLHMHEYAHDRLAAVGKSLSTMMSDTRKRLRKDGKITEDVADDASTAVVQLRSDLLEAVDAL